MMGGLYMVERNIIMGKVGGTAGKNSINYKISLPAEMVKDLGVTQDDRAVLVFFEDGKIVIKKKANP
jgi:antitoxin component of MazEF toxin-antitoxin module